MELKVKGEKDGGRVRDKGDGRFPGTGMFPGKGTFPVVEDGPGSVMERGSGSFWAIE